mgnify:CR=1 FL=1
MIFLRIEVWLHPNDREVSGIIFLDGFDLGAKWCEALSESKLLGVPPAVRNPKIT